MMSSRFIRLQRTDDGAQIIVNLASIMTIWPDFPDRTAEDPFPAATSSKLEFASGRESLFISVRETPDQILAHDLEKYFIRLSTDPLAIHANRLLIARAEPARQELFPMLGPGDTDLHLTGRDRPLRVMTTTNEIEERIGQVVG
jgi:hypothetical protein